MAEWSILWRKPWQGDPCSWDSSLYYKTFVEFDRKHLIADRCELVLTDFESKYFDLHLSNLHHITILSKQQILYVHLILPEILTKTINLIRSVASFYMCSQVTTASPSQQYQCNLPKISPIKINRKKIKIEY